MSSNTRTLAEQLEEGFSTSTTTPEEFDAEQARRREKLARAFELFGEGAPAIRPEGPASADEEPAAD